jgi:hypothetical protein
VEGGREEGREGSGGDQRRMWCQMTRGVRPGQSHTVQGRSQVTRLEVSTLVARSQVPETLRMQVGPLRDATGRWCGVFRTRSCEVQVTSRPAHERHHVGRWRMLIVLIRRVLREGRRGEGLREWVPLAEKSEF